MNSEKLKGLFLNCVEAEDSIFESGKMVFDCLGDSDRYTIDYLEIDQQNRAVPGGYDFYFFNYHVVTMSWIDTESLMELLPGVPITMVLEVAPNDPFVFCPPDHFDAYCVLDPTLTLDIANVFAFPRPLESFEDGPDYEPKEVPVIGSFGFATTGKGFELVVDAVNREFEAAVVRINIPFGAYNDDSGQFARHLAKTCQERAKAGIDVVVTHDFMTKPELINWCRQNTLNCFLYDRNMPGLAATTDQAITSGRPLIVSKNNTFRHVQKYIKPFPYQSLRAAIENTGKNVEAMQHDWSPAKFRERFEEVLETIDFSKVEREYSGTIELKILPPRGPDMIQKLRDKLAIRTRLKAIHRSLGLGRLRGKVPFAGKSYSQFGEDAIISTLFEELLVQNISYLDIGANNPKYISNTYLFYKVGYSGVLVEPNIYLCKKLSHSRPRDKILNVGIGFDESVTEADFYLYGEEADGLSTFSFADTKHWEEVGLGGKKYSVKEVVKMPLVNVNDVISQNFTECPDLVSIDVEGWDLEILRSLDFERFSPAVFCVETLAYKSDGSTYRNNEVESFFETKGYFAFRETYANTIFVNKNLYDFYKYQKENWRKHKGISKNS